MYVNGRDCTIAIITPDHKIVIPYSEETIREDIALLQEKAPVEGDGICRAIRRHAGVTGCIVTPLTIGAVPVLLSLVMGSSSIPVYVSETKNLYLHTLYLLPMEESASFGLAQYRGGQQRLYEMCRVKGFELRVMRNDAIKLKLDVCGESTSIAYHSTEKAQSQTSEMSGTVIGERFNGDNVAYKINGLEYRNIYGITLAVSKDSGIKSELWIKRVLTTGQELPQVINEMIITMQLQRVNNEHRHFGSISINLKKLVLVSDETNVNSADAVMGPLRYYVSDSVGISIVTANEKAIV